MDATGVGQPVIDLLEARGMEAWLVARLKTLLQCGCLHLPRTAEAEELARELLDYEVRPAEDANERYGAFRVGRHDDLVTALGLAVQGDESNWRRARLL